MEATKEILGWVHPLIPVSKPRYTMGVGLDPADLLEVVEQGVDMFDCVAPTRLARHGMLFVGPEENKKHRINIKNSAFAKDAGPIDPNCQCSTCKNYSCAYLHHLFAAEEMSAMRLSSIHNLHFMLDLMHQAREAIKEDRFLELKKKWS
jgi:queuine tRNA-ribosyltransferase